jgi:hypothetical protein
MMKPCAPVMSTVTSPPTASSAMNASCGPVALPACHDRRHDALAAMGGDAR